MILLGSGVAGLVYFILQNGLHGASIKGMIMALAYAWGLVLAIGLMGHGLVALPRRLFRTSSVAGKLRDLQMQAPKTKEKLDEAAETLQALENTVVQLKQRKYGAGRDLQEWIDELADTTPPPPASRPGVAAAIALPSETAIPAVLTERYLAELTRKLKRARHKKARFASEWSVLCQQAHDCQTMIDAASSQRLEFDANISGDRGFLERLNFLTPSMRYQLHVKVFPGLQVASSGLLAFASLMVIWSEIVSSFAPKISFIGITVVPSSGKVGLAGQISAAAWLLYMDACTLYAISDVKVWGNRALVKRQTYGESACWYSLQVAKLTVPLSYNFITMLRPSVYEQTSFYRFLGQLIDLTPLGKGFSTFFPCFLLIPVLATAFNLYGKVKNVFGFGILEDESDENPSGFGTGGWREGRALIERENSSRSAVTSNVGLEARNGSLDLERGGYSDAATSLPGTPRNPQREPLVPQNLQEANRQFNSITNREEEVADDGPRHFYNDFSERVRNTFDSVDKPDWVTNLGKGIKPPKWMQGDQRDESGSSALSKWFGGRAEGGRLRI